MARVLVADDDPDVRDVVVFKLEQVGHDVLVAEDGGTAPALARRELPELAVLDVMMPRMTGLDVCRELRADPATAGIPVILLTARAQEGTSRAGSPGAPTTTSPSRSVLASWPAASGPSSRAGDGAVMTR